MLLELVPRNCRTLNYAFRQIPVFELRGPMIAYASPDSTFAVTQRLISAARQSLLVGIYDFTAGYMRDLLVDAIQRGVQVTLMVDLDNVKGETGLWEAVGQAGAQVVPAPSCASKRSRYFPSCHEKVIVIDGEWTLVQSGNYTPASIPCNRVDGGQPEAPEPFAPGNRDMGLAVRSPELAAFFTDVLKGDIRLELDGPPGLGPVAEVAEAEAMDLPPALFAAARPPKMPPRLYHSRAYHPYRPVSITPVLSPDNYLEVVLPWLASARSSIYIEQQYIRPHQPQIRRLLQAIASARASNSRLNVRIILAPPKWGPPDKEIEALEGLQEFGLQAGRQVRFLNPDYFVHCHNKLIVVDRREVLVSSQNWSDTAVSENREAGLLVKSPVIALYYARLFGLDWETGLRSLPLTAAVGPAEPIQASLSDYMEV